MNKQEFLLKCIELGATDVQYSDRGYKRNQSNDIKDFNFKIEWILGGRSGGSCWDEGDTDPHYVISGEIEPEFKELDSLLAEICPNISFLQYKKLCQEVIKRNERRENEYYGNYADYGIKSCNVAELYDFLKKYKLI